MNDSCFKWSLIQRGQIVHIALTLIMWSRFISIHCTFSWDTPSPLPATLRQTAVVFLMSLWSGPQGLLQKWPHIHERQTSYCLYISNGQEEETDTLLLVNFSLWIISLMKVYLQDSFKWHYPSSLVFLIFWSYRGTKRTISSKHYINSLCQFLLKACRHDQQEIQGSQIFSNFDDEDFYIIQYIHIMKLTVPCTWDSSAMLGNSLKSLKYCSFNANIRMLSAWDEWWYSKFLKCQSSRHWHWKQHPFRHLSKQHFKFK